MNKIKRNASTDGDGYWEDDYWYEFDFDDLLINEKFIEMSDGVVVNYTKDNNCFQMNTLHDQLIFEKVTAIINDHDLKSAILNMNNPDVTTSLVCKFVILTRGVYIIEYE